MAAMTTPVAALPTTLAEAHALILAMAEERAAIEAENSRIASESAALTAANGNLAAVNQAANVRIAELTAVVKMLERTLYGTRSERLRSDRQAAEGRRILPAGLLRSCGPREAVRM
jgi:transposase